jgi:putative flavoprotein involved in K+ transport
VAAESANREASRWLQAFAKALAKHDIAGATLLFDTECYWRDLVSLTWTLKTFEGRDEVKAMLSATLSAAKPSSFVQLGPATEASGAIEAWFAF